MEIFEDYVYTKQLELDLSVIKKSVYDLNEIVTNTVIPNFVPSYSIEAPESTKFYEHYNLLMYPFPGFYDLYFSIQHLFRSIINTNRQYYVQCWVNIFKEQQFIDWHNHWLPEFKAYHGFYCVNGENTITSYKLKNGKEIDIKNKNNQIVISKSDGDFHRTYPWHDANEDRITIAFDMVPAEKIHFGFNHWIPI